MAKNYHALVIGAGPAGAVAARNLADQGHNVLVLEKRAHIAGNTYDCIDASGVLIHQYGPHIFHTNDKTVYDFLCRFASFNGYSHRVVAKVNEGLIPVPFNLTSLELVFGQEEGRALGDALISQFGAEEKVPILKLREVKDPALSRVADYIYENVFLHYTTKQWGTTPEQVDPATTGRVPVFLSRDDRYFQDTYQGLPTQGYTALFDAMLSHPNITVVCDCPANTRLSLGDDGKTYLDGEEFSHPVIYTGATDELFDYRLGALPYRTLDFIFETLPQTTFQSHGTVNYTISESYTRITEYKHMTLQTLDGVTTIGKEFSRAFVPNSGQTPYYTIASEESSALFKGYESLANRYQNLHLLGRLAEYKYYNIDAIVARSLALSNEILKS